MNNSWGGGRHYARGIVLKIDNSRERLQRRGDHRSAAAELTKISRSTFAGPLSFACAAFSSAGRPSERWLRAGVVGMRASAESAGALSWTRETVMRTVYTLGVGTARSGLWFSLDYVIIGECLITAESRCALCKEDGKRLGGELICIGRVEWRHRCRHV